MAVCEYEVYALRYATVNRAARDNFLGGPSADLHDSEMPLDFYVWLIRNDEVNILVDTGFSPASAVARKRDYLCQPIKGLKLLGVEPEAVDHVVLTHFHYDHAGNTDSFPQACFHVQESEMRFATGRYMAHPSLNHFYAVADVQNLVGHVFKGRVRFHDGLGQLAEGVSLHRVGGHTDGLQIVRVHTKRGWVVLASDAAHYYRNKMEAAPFPVIFNVGDMLEGWRLIDELAESHRHIIPGHDPEVRRIYPVLDHPEIDISLLHEMPHSDPY